METSPGNSISIIDELRKPRIYLSQDLNISVFDTVGTIVIAYSVAKYMNWNPYLTVGMSFPLAYISHKVFMIETPLTNKTDEIINNNT